MNAGKINNREDLLLIQLNDHSGLSPVKDCVWAAHVVSLARRVRAAQKLYFKSRSQTDLIESKRLEKELDALLEAGE